MRANDDVTTPKATYYGDIHSNTIVTCGECSFLHKDTSKINEPYSCPVYCYESLYRSWYSWKSFSGNSVRFMNEKINLHGCKLFSMNKT